VEVGVLYKMARDSKAKRLSSFLKDEFSRVSISLARDICRKAKLLSVKPSRITLKQVEVLHKLINDGRLRAIVLGR